VIKKSKNLQYKALKKVIHMTQRLVDIR